MKNRIRNKKGVFLLIPELIFLGVIGASMVFGAIKTNAGEWGPNGSKAVKNCPDHVNGNCAHLKLN